jgi:hypothetical protein
MSVTRFQEVASGQLADEDSKYVRNYTRSFIAETNSKSDGPAAIRAYAGTPALWSAHPDDAQALCQSVNIQQGEPSPTGHFFTVSTKYSTKYDQQQQQNPLDEPVKQSLSFTHTQRALDRDIDDIPITNTSGDKPSEPAMITESYPVLRFVRNEATIPVALALQYIDRINSDTFYGGAAGTMRVTNISSSDQQTKNDVQFYTVTYEIEYRAKTWKLKYLNEGYNARRTDGSKIRVAGSDPRLLEADGDPSGTGVCKTNFTNTPEFVERNQYESVAFSGLGL